MLDRLVSVHPNGILVKHWNLLYRAAKGSFYKVGYLTLDKKLRGGKSPQNFIRTLRCHTYKRFKFHSLEFIILASRKFLFLQFFNKLLAKMLMMVYIKFHSK